MKARREPRLVCEKLFNRFQRGISHYRSVVPLPSSVPPRGTSPYPHWAGFFVWRRLRHRSALARATGCEILLCFDREPVLKSSRDAAGHGGMNTQPRRMEPLWRGFHMGLS